MDEVGLHIIASEMNDACKAEPDLLERIRIAMRGAQNHWMVTNEQEQFRGALAAAMLASSEDEKDRITRSLQPMKALSAMMSGVPVDFDAVAKSMGAEDLIPLKKMWDEIRAER